MSKMGRYLKAYPVEHLREYPGWAEFAREPVDRPYLYLQENYTVTEGIFLDEDLVFDKVTPEWTAFCHARLRFQIPNGDDSSSQESGR